MKSILKNSNGQVRSGWKIFCTFGLYIVVSSIICGIIMFIYGMMMIHGDLASNLPEFTTALDSLSKSDLTSMNNGITSIFTIILRSVDCLILISSVVLFWHVFEKKSVSYMGMTKVKNGSSDLLKGLILGALSLIAIFAILYFTNNISLNNSLLSPHINSALLSGIFIFILVGINEEMFARGYCISVLNQTNRKYAPAVIASIIFSLMHSLNPSMSLLSYLNLFLFGLLASYMFIKSGSLWLSIGYHITWNLFESSIFGFKVSGQVTSSLYDISVHGSDIITGGNFGPEGGLIVTLVTILGFIYMWKFYKPKTSSY